MTSGLVVGDRLLRPELHTTPARAYEDGRALADRWHGSGRSRYAVIPRFSLSCSDDLLDSCAALHADVAGSWFTSHINENPAEIAKVRELFGGSYLDSYDKHGLVGPRSVFAHNVHPGEGELELLAAAGAAVAHCPTSNCALGSGLFALRPSRRHRRRSRARFRRRRGHRAVAVQGGAAGLLRAADARPGRDGAHGRAPAVPGHRGRRRRARDRATRSAT